MKSKSIHVVATIIISILIGAGIAWTETVTLPYTFVPNTPARANEVNANFTVLQTNLEWAIQRIYELEAKLAYTSVNYYEVNGVAGPHVIFEGVNVHVRSGSGSTDDGGSLTGLGNLIVGYNEEPSVYVAGRSGSHSLILGARNEFSSYGGAVAGYNNTISNSYATVTGGYLNEASGDTSSVSAGNRNTASGAYSSVSGGSLNRASAWTSSVSGGYTNTASGDSSSVSGGNSNTASGNSSSVSGGYTRSAGGPYDWVAGTLFQDQ